jgi:hypothetical protein
MRTESSSRETKLEVAVKNGRLVITHLPAGRPPEETTSRRSKVASHRDGATPK